jgi:imidazole glycerol phosphate synthase glutamine amidotransferase subunit
MIGIIDMETNNIKCFIKICEKYKYKYKIIKNNNDYNDDINKLIIPGIGNYNNCMTYIKNNNLDKIIHLHINNNKKILGICIGMQIFTEYGTEGGIIEGLHILKNTKTTLLNTSYILPNIGWSNIYSKNEYNNICFQNINLKNDFYFVHSYNILFNDISNINSDYKIYYSQYYDVEFISAIITDNLLLTQFHPEKSGQNGVNIIKNFLSW